MIAAPAYAGPDGEYEREPVVAGAPLPGGRREGPRDGAPPGRPARPRHRRSRQGAVAAGDDACVRQEVELAKAEVGEKGKKAGVGAGLLGGAGVAGLLPRSGR